MKKEITFINKHHALLVFPIKNKNEPLSLWQVLYPRSKMRWEWTEDADNRVVRLWHSKEELSRSGQVVYSKWYKGKATFFSKELFTYLLALNETAKLYEEILNNKHNSQMEIKLLLEAVDQDSPLSTKQVKVACGLQGKLLESRFNKVSRFLWQNFCLVAYGEIEDSSFPSLGYASPKIMFEDLWIESQKISPAKAKTEIEKLLKDQPAFLSEVLKPFSIRK